MEYTLEVLAEHHDADGRRWLTVRTAEDFVLEARADKAPEYRRAPLPNPPTPPVKAQPAAVKKP